MFTRYASFRSFTSWTRNRQTLSSCVTMHVYNIKPKYYLLGNSSVALPKNLVPSSTSVNNTHSKQVFRHLSQTPPEKRIRTHSIWSYFSSSQKQLRERRRDGMPLPEATQKQDVLRVFTLRTPASTKGFLTFTTFFHSIQVILLSSLLSSAKIIGTVITGNIASLPIPWSECLVCDQVGIALASVTTSGIMFGLAFVLWRFPIRIYYDQQNGIYTAVFCRLFLPFKTITFSFPAESVEELPPNKAIESLDFYHGPTLKIRPVHRDVYIHHLEALAAEEKENQEGTEKAEDKAYFPPAATAATIATKNIPSNLQQREYHELLKFERPPGKVGYVPPAYAAAVSALARDKAILGNRFISWAAAEKICYIPIQGFATPIFYYKMLKREDESA